MSLLLAFPSCESDQVAKARAVHYGHIGQVLAVDIDTCCFQPVHELAVSHTLRAAGGINALYPQTPEIALAFSPVEKRIAQRMYHGFIGAFDKAVSGTALALG